MTRPLTVLSGEKTMTTRIEGSNSLAELAAKVQAEHKAVTAALSKAVEHALQAGAYLTEAKESLPHGQWLPWLERCEVSRRTAPKSTRGSNEPHNSTRCCARMSAFGVKRAWLFALNKKAPV
jgi:hypothetical protein